MNNNLAELPVFLVCLWSGFLIGCVYELLYLIRTLDKKAATVLADIFFGAAFFIICEQTLLYCDHGSVRLNSVLGTAAGFLLFRLFPGRVFRKAVDSIIRRLKRKNKRNEVDLYAE